MIGALLDHISLKNLFSGLIIVYILFKITQWLNTERKIRALGGHAPRIPTYLPFGIDLIYNAIIAAVNHRNLEQWKRWFASTNNSHSSRYTVEQTPLGRRTIFTADPENIKAILATQFTDYGKGEPFHREWSDFLGDSIFTTDLEQWHTSRQLIRPLFIKDRVSDLAIFEEHVKVLIRKIKETTRLGIGSGKEEYERGGGRLDVNNLFFRYTLDAATHFLLGSSVGSLEVPEQEFAEAFAEVQRVQNIIARAGPLNPFVPRKSFEKGIRVINTFVQPFIDQTLALSPAELATKTKSEEGYTFLHALASFTRDRKVLRDQLVAVLLAGRDTTASALSWVFFELAKHPDVFAKLRREIIEHVD